jgi:cyclopropane fatty-acyl-phospholipid synthase-like methyltransferase
MAWQTVLLIVAAVAVAALGFAAVRTLGKSSGSRRARRGEMARYWDQMASENARMHIAINHWESERAFEDSGEESVRDLLASEHVKILPGSRVVDIGVGIGRMMKPLAQRFPEADFHGIDVSDEMVRQARERMADLPNVTVTANTGSDLRAFGDGQIDLVYSYIVLQHIPRPLVREYFREVGRVLKPGGIFRFQMQEGAAVPTDDPPDDDYRTVRTSTPDMISALCAESGLWVLQIEKRGYLWVTATRT